MYLSRTNDDFAKGNIMGANDILRVIKTLSIILLILLLLLFTNKNNKYSLIVMLLIKSMKEKQTCKYAKI